MTYTQTTTEEKKKERYTPSEQVENYRKAWEALKAPDPYVSAYGEESKKLYDQVMNPEAFRFDLEGNGLYRQYRDQYIDQGHAAMEDTLGKTAALTGGYASSYAQNLGQQAYNAWLEKLNGRVGEIYELEYGRYRDALSDLNDRYRTVKDAEKADYDRWTADYNRYLAQEKAARQLYENERQFDYDAWLELLEYYQQQTQWEAEMALAMDKWNTQKAKSSSSKKSSGKKTAVKTPLVEKPSQTTAAGTAVKPAASGGSTVRTQMTR